MKTSTVVLSVVGVTVLAIGTCVGAGYFWIRRNAGELKEQGVRIKEEASAFAKGRSDRECMAEALARAERGSGILDQARARVFLRACLDAVEDTAEVCAGTPPQAEIMASVKWQMQACTELGAKDVQMCGRVVQGAQDHCHPQ